MRYIGVMSLREAFPTLFTFTSSIPHPEHLPSRASLIQSISHPEHLSSKVSELNLSFPVVISFPNAVSFSIAVPFSVAVSFPIIYSWIIPSVFFLSHSTVQLYHQKLIEYRTQSLFFLIASKKHKINLFDKRKLQSYSSIASIHSY